MHLFRKRYNIVIWRWSVTDEQHRFGVKQRETFSYERCRHPHILVMSATPIPRTLAIILYGDLDISVIDEVPAKRLPIKNCVVNTTYRKTAYKFMEKEIRAGHQVYIICPLVEAKVNWQKVKMLLDYALQLQQIFSIGYSGWYTSWKNETSMRKML